MIKKLQQKLKSKKGFTLIELLIVIAVLGIIAAIAVPRFSGVLTDVKGKADVRAAELFTKEVEAELMIGGLTLADAGPWTIAAANDLGFGGTLPASQKTPASTLTATITKTGTNYKIEIKVGNAGTAIYTKENVSGPIQ